MIGPFSTTLIPLSSSSSVDRQVLINAEASAISPDERKFGFIFTKIPFTRRSVHQIACTFSLFAPPKCFSTSRHCYPQSSPLSCTLCVFVPAGFTSVKVFSWSVKARGTCGCAVSVTTLCLSRAIIWTARLDELRVTPSIRFTPVPTSR